MNRDLFPYGSDASDAVGVTDDSTDGADSADTDEVKMNWFFKIDFIHICYLPNLSILINQFYSIPTAYILQIENGESDWKKIIIYE